MPRTEASAAASGTTKSVSDDDYAYNHVCFVQLENDGGTLLWPALSFDTFAVLYEFLEQREMFDSPLFASVNYQFTRYVTKKGRDGHARAADPVALLLGSKNPTGRRLVFCPTISPIKFHLHLPHAVEAAKKNADLDEAMDVVKDILGVDDNCPPTPTKPPRPVQQGEIGGDAMDESSDEPVSEEAKLPAKPKSAKSTKVKVTATHDDDAMSTDESVAEEDTDKAPSTTEADSSATLKEKNGESTKSKATTSKNKSVDKSESTKKATATDEGDDESDASVEEEFPEHLKKKPSKSTKSKTSNSTKPTVEESESRKRAADEDSDESDASVEEESLEEPEQKRGKPTKSKARSRKNMSVDQPKYAKTTAVPDEASDESDASVEDESLEEPEQKRCKPTKSKDGTRKTQVAVADEARDESDASVEEQSIEELEQKRGSKSTKSKSGTRHRNTSVDKSKTTKKVNAGEASDESDASVEEESFAKPKQKRGSKSTNSIAGTRRNKSVDKSNLKRKAADDATDASVTEEESPQVVQRKLTRSSKGNADTAKKMSIDESADKARVPDDTSDASVTEEESPEEPQRKRDRSLKPRTSTVRKMSVDASKTAKRPLSVNEASDESVATNEEESLEVGKPKPAKSKQRRASAPNKPPVAEETSDESVATTETETPLVSTRKRGRPRQSKAAPKKPSVGKSSAADDSLSFVGNDEDSPAKRTRSSKAVTKNPKRKGEVSKKAAVARTVPKKKATNSRSKNASSVASTKKSVSHKRKGEEMASSRKQKRPKSVQGKAVNTTPRKASPRIANKAKKSSRGARSKTQAIVATPESSPEQSNAPRELLMPEKIPSLDEVRPLLKKAGITFANGRYVLKGVDPSQDKYVLDRDYFENGARLRRYLCAYGIDSNGYEWTEQEKETLALWVRTAIVPGLWGVKGKIPRQLRDWVRPHSLLHDLGFRCPDGTCYVLPGEKPNVVDSLVLNGRQMKGEDGLMVYLARFGLPQNCEFDNVKEEDRILLEYTISQRAKAEGVDTFKRIEAKDTDPPIFSDGDRQVPRVETTQNGSPASCRSVTDATLITNSTTEDKAAEEDDEADADFRPDGDFATTTHQEDAEHHARSKDSPVIEGDDGARESVPPITQPDCDQSIGSDETTSSPPDEAPGTKNTKETNEYVEDIDRAAAEGDGSPIAGRSLFAETPGNKESLASEVDRQQEPENEDSNVVQPERASINESEKQVATSASPPSDAFQKEINDMFAEGQSPAGSENVMNMMEDSPEAADFSKGSAEFAVEATEGDETASAKQSPVDATTADREADSEVSRARSAQVRMSDGNSVAQSPIKMPKGAEKEDDGLSLIEVKPDDPWNDAESKMIALGWTHAPGRGLVNDFWLPPCGKTPANGGRLNEDYVEEKFGMKLYAHKHFGWKGDEAFHRELEASQSTETSRNGRPARIKALRPGNIIDTPGTQSKGIRTRSSPDGVAKLPAKKRAADARTSPNAKKQKVGVASAPKTADKKLRAGHPDLKKSVGDKLKACQKALETSFNVKTLTAVDEDKTKFQRNVDGITTFLRGAVGSEGAHGRKARESACLYVCGAPGTGKSTSVNWAIKEVQKWASDQQNLQHLLLPSFCYINAAAIGSANQISEKIADALSLKGKRSLSDVKKALDSSRGRSSKTSCLIVVVDEIEMLVSETGRTSSKPCSSGEEVLKMLADWSSNEDLRFAMIGISNSIGDQKASRLQTFGLTDNTITFSTYREEDLIRIIEDRIGNKIVDPQAVGFAAKKVAATSGDARKVLELVSSAADKCLKSLSKEQRKARKMDKPIVSLGFMLKAARETVADYVDKIESVPPLARTILCVAVTLNQVGTVSDGMTIGKLKKYVYQSQDNGLFDDDMSLDEFNSLVQNLIDAGLLHAGTENSFDVSSQQNFQSLYETPIRLGIQLHDLESVLEKTLGDQPLYRGIMERAKRLG